LVPCQFLPESPMGLVGEMRDSKWGLGIDFFFPSHLPFFRMPVGGATGVAVEVDMIRYVTWKKKEFQEDSRKWDGVKET
jgi:hypothetical protein